MQKRGLGTSNLEVSTIGLGCMGMKGTAIRKSSRKRPVDEPVGGSHLCEAIQYRTLDRQVWV